VHLVDQRGNIVAQSDRQPGGVCFPTSLWQSGKTLLDKHTLLIPGDAPSGVSHLLGGMYIHPSVEPLGEPRGLRQINIAE
jgi:hypothetical protein